MSAGIMGIVMERALIKTDGFPGIEVLSVTGSFAPIYGSHYFYICTLLWEQIFNLHFYYMLPIVGVFYMNHLWSGGS